MRRKNVNPDLQTRIREYLNFIWNEEKSQHTEEEAKVIKSLSYSLKEELALETNGEFLKKISFFPRYFSERGLTKMAMQFKEIFLTPEDVVFQVMRTEFHFVYFIFYPKAKHP